MASLVSPQSERQVPPRTACVAGRHLEVIERSCPVVRFMMGGLGAAGDEGKGKAPQALCEAIAPTPGARYPHRG